jgi:copper chaperone CopZ
VHHNIGRPEAAAGKEKTVAEKTVKIPDISCHHCVNNIKREVGELEGVQSVEGSVDEKSMTFVFAEPANWDRIKGLLNEIGYPPQD